MFRLEQKISSLKNYSRYLFAGLFAGIILTIGIGVGLSFTEPDAGPSGFSEPESFLDQGDWFAYGRGWVASSSGDSSTLLTKTACENASNWEWFEDGNGDGDYTDEEDGICVKTTTVNSLSWNGYDYGTDYDNSYIAGYECEGNFPSGTIKSGSYSGIDSFGNATTTWQDGYCALCQADCYDGRRDLPAQGSYTSNAGGAGGYIGPLDPADLKNWTGTRLPTANDFLGYCGYKDGGSDYETGCSSATTTGANGYMIGRTDECLDLSDSSYEWLSEQHSYGNARVAGGNACSYVYYYSVYYDNRFRAVFRP